jgi:hypothetical protein
MSLIEDLNDLKELVDISSEDGTVTKITQEVYNNAKDIVNRYPQEFNNKKYAVFGYYGGVVFESVDEVVSITIHSETFSFSVKTVKVDGTEKLLYQNSIELTEDNFKKALEFIDKYRKR